MELQQYGDDDTQTEQQQRALVLNAISRFCQNFADYMQGNCRHKDQSILYGPARLRHIFTVEFRQNVNALDSRDALSDEDIHTVICHAPLLVLDVVHVRDAQLCTYDHVQDAQLCTYETIDPQSQAAGGIECCGRESPPIIPFVSSLKSECLNPIRR